MIHFVTYYLGYFLLLGIFLKIIQFKLILAGGSAFEKLHIFSALFDISTNDKTFVPSIKFEFLQTKSQIKPVLIVKKKKYLKDL